MISPNKRTGAKHLRDGRSSRYCSLPASSCLWWCLLTTVINSDQYRETGESKPSDWTCLELAWLHPWYYTSKMPGLCFCNCDWTYPWPIFSNRVYFFLGSPTLTMLPERNKIKDAHLKMETPPSSRSEILPHCLGLWAICSQLGNTTTTTTNRGSSVAQVASTKTDFLVLWRVTSTGN